MKFVCFFTKNIKKMKSENQTSFFSVSKNTIYSFLTRWETLKNGSEFVKPLSSAFFWVPTKPCVLWDKEKEMNRVKVSRKRETERTSFLLTHGRERFGG